MRRIAIVTGAILGLGLNVVVASAAFAAEASAATVAGQEQPADAKDDASRRVCKMVMPTGSRLALRTCRTKAEWERQALQYQRDAEQQRRNHEAVQPGAFTTAF
jgi:hypothetical protein